MEPCCRLGDILNRPDEILYQTDNFFVTPTYGSIGCEGYLLLLSKEHFEGTGEMDEELHTEFDEVVTHTKRVLEEVYGSVPFVFEHGPRVKGYHGGGCLDHAHVHLVPGVDPTSAMAIDLIKKLEETNQYFRIDRVEGIKRIVDIAQARDASYICIEPPKDPGKRLVTEVNFHIPSQYLRRMIADEKGTTGWNWRMAPDLETFQRSMDTLQGRF